MCCASMPIISALVGLPAHRVDGVAEKSVYAQHADCVHRAFHRVADQALNGLLGRAAVLGDGLYSRSPTASMRLSSSHASAAALARYS